jgi:hypothetical protein
MSLQGNAKLVLLERTDARVNVWLVCLMEFPSTHDANVSRNLINVIGLAVEIHIGLPLERISCTIC